MSACPKSVTAPILEVCSTINKDQGQAAATRAKFGPRQMSQRLLRTPNPGPEPWELGPKECGTCHLCVMQTAIKVLQGRAGWGGYEYLGNRGSPWLMRRLTVYCALVCRWKTHSAMLITRFPVGAAGLHSHNIRLAVMQAETMLFAVRCSRVTAASALMLNIG